MEIIKLESFKTARFSQGKSSNYHEYLEYNLKYNSHSIDLIEKKKATTFVLEQPNDTSVEQETSRSPSAKAKKRQISHYSVNSK